MERMSVYVTDTTQQRLNLHGECTLPVLKPVRSLRPYVWQLFVLSFAILWLHKRITRFTTRLALPKDLMLVSQFSADSVSNVDAIVGICLWYAEVHLDSRISVIK